MTSLVVGLASRKKVGVSFSGIMQHAMYVYTYMDINVHTWLICYGD